MFFFFKSEYCEKGGKNNHYLCSIIFDTDIDIFLYNTSQLNVSISE